MRKAVIIKCDCNCSCLSIDRFDDADEYYLTVYKSRNTSFFYRIKTAFKYILGNDIITTDMVLNKDEFNKLKEFK